MQINIGCPFHGCIIATFITKTQLSTLMWEKIQCVLIQKYLHVAGLDLDWRLGLSLVFLASTRTMRVLALALAFWPRLTSLIIYRMISNQ